MSSIMRACYPTSPGDALSIVLKSEAHSVLAHDKMNRKNSVDTLVPKRVQPPTKQGFFARALPLYQSTRSSRQRFL